MQSIIFWVSVLEIGVFAFGLLLFFSLPSEMSYLFIHSLHPLRGIMGLLIRRRIPQSHEIMAQLELNKIKG